MPSPSPPPATASFGSVDVIVPSIGAALVEVPKRRHCHHEHRDGGRNRLDDAHNRLDGISIAATGVRIEPVGVVIAAAGFRSGPAGPRIPPEIVPI